MNILNATEARKRFFEILNDVIFKGEEYVVEKKDAGTVRIVPERYKKPSPQDIDRVLKEFKKTFKKAAKKKYWSVLDTPAWEKKDRKYLDDLYKGIIR